MKPGFHDSGNWDFQLPLPSNLLNNLPSVFAIREFYEILPEIQHSPHDISLNPKLMYEKQHLYFSQTV
jgi:hypothetical protein